VFLLSRGLGIQIALSLHSRRQFSTSLCSDSPPGTAYWLARAGDRFKRLGVFLRAPSGP
jgi:hypothetical protein